MWNKLSMNDRAAIIKLAVSNGITNLDEIRKVYNKYAEGGPLKTDNTPWKKHLLKIASDIDNKYLGGEGMAAYNKKVQQEKNRRITDEEVVDSYIDNVLYTMENPNNTGYKDDKYYPYADSSSPKNLGPGINYTSDMAEGLDFSGKKGYTKEELNEKIRPHLLENMEGIMSDLYDMYGEDIDTMSLGNRMILLDISHNVRPRGKKRANMPKAWPSLVNGMATGDKKKIEKNTYSGSTRRQSMRNDLIFKNLITPTTVINK